MTSPDAIDTGRLSLALSDLRLPAIKTIWPDFAARADKEGWPAARFLAALAEYEMAERASRRIQRHLDEARLPPGKTLDSFDFSAVPMISKAQVMDLMPERRPEVGQLEMMRGKENGERAAAAIAEHNSFGQPVTQDVAGVGGPKGR